MGLTLPRCALRASLRLSEFAPGKFVESPEVLHHLSPPDTQNAPLGAFAYLAEREGFEPSIGF